MVSECILHLSWFLRVGREILFDVSAQTQMKNVAHHWVVRASHNLRYTLFQFIVQRRDCELDTEKLFLGIRLPCLILVGVGQFLPPDSPDQLRNYTFDVNTMRMGDQKDMMSYKKKENGDIGTKPA